MIVLGLTKTYKWFLISKITTDRPKSVACMLESVSRVIGSILSMPGSVSKVRRSVYLVLQNDRVCFKHAGE